MPGRYLMIFAACVLACFAVGLWYTQMYTFYEKLPETHEITVADRTIPVTAFKGVDANTSPIKLRACLELDPAALEGLPPADKPVPLVAPHWFECFDARAIGKALEAGEARAYLAASEEFDGSERMIAVYPDGRAFMWRQLSPEFSK